MPGLDAVFRPGIDTPFYPTSFDDLSMWGWEGSVENPIVLDEEEDKENSPLAPSTPVSVRPTEPPRLQSSHAFGARIENIPDYSCRIFFSANLTVFVFLYKLYLTCYIFSYPLPKTSQSCVRIKLF